jgi:hypothetical protein
MMSLAHLEIDAGTGRLAVGQLDSVSKRGGRHVA